MTRVRARGLRIRFAVAAALLVLTTVTASVWTFFALTRLSQIASDTVAQSESVTAVTSRLAGALEREDDAVLLILAGDTRGHDVLIRERAIVDGAVVDLVAVLDPVDQRELARPLQTELGAYRQASDAVIAVATEREALVEYHQKANPVLRRAVALTTAVRDRHFELARRAVAGVRDEAAQARRAVLMITVTALGIAIAVAWRLSTTIVGPVRRLTHGAEAIRKAEFTERIELASGDELGELAAAFNQMASDLAEFRRTNVREVVRAKNALEATLEALPDAVVLFDAAGSIQSMNRAAVRVLDAAGVNAPRAITDLRLPGLDLDAVRRAIATGAQAMGPVDLARTIAVAHDATVHRLFPRVVPVPALSTGHGGAVLLLYDVTELAHVDEMRSELVAVASHELQTPLTTLRMTLLMLRETADAFSDRQRDLVATALLGVEQLAEIVREFLDLTRIEAGELRLNLEAVRLADVIAEALQRVDGQAKAQGIRLSAETRSDLPTISADPLRLRVVFDNLLSNALKYTPQGGEVTIHSHLESRDPAFLMVRVVDTGPGIPAAYQSRIFDKFFRLEHHQPDDRVNRGAGIGLYMCRQIVELHGGEISCSAGPHGRGTSIDLRLPVRSTTDVVATDGASYAWP